MVIFNYYEKRTKKTYRIRNWKEYNAALVERGSLTLWVDEKAVEGWLNQEKTRKRGAPRKFADTAIECMATLSIVYRLALRATEGMMISIVKLLAIELPVPDYTTLSRRKRKLEIELPRRATNEPLHIVVDTTGMKVYGESEWKVRQHGWSKRRTWRKLHLAVDEKSGEIVAAMASTDNVSDGRGLVDLIEQVDDEIKQVSADGSYDKRPAYEAIHNRKAKAVVPPQHNARIWQHGNSKKEPLARDENLRRIRKVGRAKWKRESAYHRRSLAETTVFRIKIIFGEKINGRSFPSQACEMLLRCAILNRMTHLGMPDSYPIEF